MRVKGLLGMFVVALLAMVAVSSRQPAATGSEVAAPPVPEKPWLSHEVADQIIGPGGSLGPLFVGVSLGGRAPSDEIRETIAAFAHANDVDIDLEIVDDELVAIRFAVTFGGCCGYEGADVLGRRLGQPKYGGTCGGDDPRFYWDNWAVAHEDGTHVRARVKVNRLSLRWERTVSFDEVVARAESALGADRETIREGAGDHWIEVESGKRYWLEMPYAFASNMESFPARSQPAERGIQLVTDRRIVTEVTFKTEEDRERLRKRWGKPRVNADGDLSWYRSDRTIVARTDDYRNATTVTISRR